MKRHEPEGWSFEGDDPSVGIFGVGYWHDSCYVLGDIPPAEESQESGVPVGEGADRYVPVRVRLRCPACGATAEWTEQDPDPECPEEVAL